MLKEESEELVSPEQGVAAVRVLKAMLQSYTPGNAIVLTSEQKGAAGVILAWLEQGMIPPPIYDDPYLIYLNAVGDEPK